MNKLQNKILKIIISERQEDLDIMKYKIVTKAIMNNYHVEEILDYIGRSLLNLKQRPKMSLQAFAILRAYEYLVYLENAHELSHETERLQ